LHFVSQKMRCHHKSQFSHYYFTDGTDDGEEVIDALQGHVDANIKKSATTGENGEGMSLDCIYWGNSIYLEDDVYGKIYIT
jgi:hypothetical protein